MIIRRIYLATYILIIVLLCSVLAQWAVAQDGSVVFSGTSWRDFPGGAEAVCADADIDNDNDGLIEICYLEDVDAIRYQLDGSGLRRSSDANRDIAGCRGGAGNTCNGYELVRDLDFDDDDSYRDVPANKSSWTTGVGWPYIGSETNEITYFSGILEGNGHTIANLFVNAPTGNQRYGRFIERISGTVRNLGLKDVDITITGGNQRGAIFTHELAGTGRITNCYISGVSNYNGADRFSAFVQDSLGRISNSYVDMEFNGPMRGLFVGENRDRNNGVVSNSYVIGDAMNAGNTRGFLHTNNGLIANVYYAVQSSGGSAAIAIFNQWRIRSSYYDSDKWGGTMRVVELNRFQGTDENSRGYSTMDLQMPTAANTDDTSSPYYQWSEDNWYFGIDAEYPLLKYGRGDDGGNSACGNSQQPRCGILLRGQGIVLTDASLSGLELVSDDQRVIDIFQESTTTYTVRLPNTVERARVMPTATQGNSAAITVSVGNFFTETVASGSTTTELVRLEGGEETTIDIVVTAPDGETQIAYRVFLIRAASDASDDVSLSDLKLVGDDETGIDLIQESTTAYTVGVRNEVARVRVMPTVTDSGATITVDGITVASNATSGAIDLTEGGDTLITIVVTAADAITTETYTVTVSRAQSDDATLGDLVLTQMDGVTIIPLTDDFASETTMYTASVANEVAQVRVMPTANSPHATIQVGDDTVASGGQSEDIMLTVGAVTTIPIVVTAQDRTENTYTIAVFRRLNSNATLSGLVLTQADGAVIPLDNTFLLTTTTYTLGVSVQQVRVMPTATAGALSEITVSANNFTETVASGSATAEVVTLGEINEDTTINIAVTAQDGTQLVYRLILFRTITLWSDFPGGAVAVCSDDNIDNDRDGLIEMCYLEDVDAMRYQLDGTGYRRSSTATLVTTGCGGGDGDSTCNGYELVRDLDFNDDDSYRDAPANRSSWTTGAGWRYIGSETDGRTIFSGILEGNGHTIANLFVNASPGNQRH
ncbi:MAG: cadherin-like beta sandwich domain-containing protein, partial [Chromatiales bacterium]|nr:cadherin-like beta sandwich domain-containing protein [Chromatiales bacterium]